MTDLAAISLRLESDGPEAALCWAAEEFGHDVVLACSLGGPSGMVLIDMTFRLALHFEVFYLDTGLLFPETYAMRDEIERRYGIQPVAYKPALTLSQQAAAYGEGLWRTDPDRCCALRKVEPNRRALAGKRAWISGIRRDQTQTRRATQVVGWDERFGLIKVSPLAAWREDQVWDYIRANDVPYHPLHRAGYRSIGCMPCTRAVEPHEDARAGRWAAFAKIECGLHRPINTQPIELHR
ncbi:MAG: phosphoadenylyl-sulfate reductase [Chloroflexota bacterium]|nr:phosphoadenylyl-sulfate reductase [Chloroflexota bacterium]